MKEQSYQTVSSSLFEELKNFQLAQVGFKDEIQGRVTRFVKAVDESISNEKIQECIHDPEKLQELLEKKVLKSNSSKMRYALEDIQEKYHDIIRLEKVILNTKSISQNGNICLVEQDIVIFEFLVAHLAPFWLGEDFFVFSIALYEAY